jgi:Reverse transcriptase (RNA-dependent DNA polymerase)
MSDIDEIWGNDGILGFPINCNAVLTHLKQDLRDDWFFDTIHYKDLLSARRDLKETLLDLLLEGNGTYPGTERTICDIPKKGLGIRYALETDFYDRFIYQAICSYLIPFFDPLLSHRVLGHRYNKNRNAEKYLFKERIELWKTFEGVTYTTFKDKKTLLATDLINYFENITTDNVRRAFESKLPQIDASGKEKLRIRNAIRTLCDMLEKWSYSGSHGLPQNRDPSSFIANMVLNDVDHALVHRGYDYYRYVDDIRIICDSPQEARKSLTELIKELRTVGMNINSAKTRILGASDTPEVLAEFFPNTDDRSAAIDNMWRSRSRRVITRSVPLICEMLKDCIDKKESQSRQFRFAVNRLSMLIEADLFDIRSDISSALVEAIIKTLEEQPASADQYCRLLALLDIKPAAMLEIEQYLVNDARAIHQWQNYHIWFMLAKKRHVSEALSAAAKDRITKSPLSAEIPAIFIYLHCTQGSDALKEFIPSFSVDWPYQHQRHFLLAAKGLPAEELKTLVPHLKRKTTGTIQRATPYFNSEGIPLAEKEPLKLFELYDNISPYD